MDYEALTPVDIHEANLSYPLLGNRQLRNHDPDKINLLMFYLHERKSTFIGEAEILQEQKKAAASLIHIINKEYHLNNE
ncbi:MAG TPA: hypothetical protein VFU62_01580 [Hanamia sp.]|jgi:hypothetical protein|nr:hypothetical protein [Hanamia sp.]